MKFSFPFAGVMLILFAACNQEQNSVAIPQVKRIDTIAPLPKNNFASPDQSPMDMSYFPIGYPLMKMKGNDTVPLVARLIYSRPQKNGRQIFGNSPESLCKYGKEWRLGANEASEIEFFRDVFIKNKRVEKGRYVIYCIPYPDRWTIILNTNLYTWGLHMDKSQDKYSFDIPTIQLTPAVEDFTMAFLPADNGTELLMAWDSVKALLPVEVKY